MFLMRSVARIKSGLKINRHTTATICALTSVRLHSALRSWPFRKMMPGISGTWSLTPQRLLSKQDCLNEPIKFIQLPT
ncbi:hypothetical protein HanPSC8_Chr13g0572151 [Helianthus annuus]|nr:hypothetical protein HanPSC8_Chr13g0572151 [Helianthus annuus]